MRELPIALRSGSAAAEPVYMPPSLHAGIPKILTLELSMEILFKPWLPPVLLAVGICMLLKTKGAGPKIVGGLLALAGGLLTAFEIWIYSKHYHR